MDNGCQRPERRLLDLRPKKEKSGQRGGMQRTGARGLRAWDEPS